MSLPYVSEADSSAKSYGCIYCMTGKEDTAAKNIENSCPGIRATPVRQVKRRTVCGDTSLAVQIAFPGYVFVEVDPAQEFFFHLPKGNWMTLLSMPSSGWKLFGDDERFARWLFSMDGLITLSEAYLEGDRVKIVSGPLKDLEGCIQRIDKRNRNGQIRLTLRNRAIQVWLGFEFVEKQHG